MGNLIDRVRSARGVVDFLDAIYYTTVTLSTTGYGDIAPAGYGYPIDDMMASGEYPQWTYDSMPPALKTLHQWGGESYGVLNDADGKVGIGASTPATLLDVSTTSTSVAATQVTMIARLA